MSYYIPTRRHETYSAPSPQNTIFEDKEETYGDEDDDATNGIGMAVEEKDEDEDEAEETMGGGEDVRAACVSHGTIEGLASPPMAVVCLAGRELRP